MEDAQIWVRKEKPIEQTYKKKPGRLEKIERYRRILWIKRGAIPKSKQTFVYEQIKFIIGSIKNTILIACIGYFFIADDGTSSFQNVLLMII